MTRPQPTPRPGKHAAGWTDWCRKQWADHRDRVLFLAVFALLAFLVVLPFALGGGDHPMFP
ncbi:hypothetical protein [Nocardioides bigeumensis]|uniref:ABC transporter permease n=1 Tax=Nocardioides bigeumensis TaxID=433657 RepID=A0ABN2Y4X3_9ACTN